MLAVCGSVDRRHRDLKPGCQRFTSKSQILSICDTDSPLLCPGMWNGSLPGYCDET